MKTFLKVLRIIGMVLVWIPTAILWVLLAGLVKLLLVANGEKTLFWRFFGSKLEARK